MPDLTILAAVDAVTASSFVAPIISVIDWILVVAAVGTELYALIHSAAQRADAFTAAGKLSKPAWLGINAGALILTLLFGIGPSSIFGLIAITAALVYIVDVRPAVKEVSGGGSSSW
jgi:hypothetical protein